MALNPRTGRISWGTIGDSGSHPPNHQCPPPVLAIAFDDTYGLQHGTIAHRVHGYTFAFPISLVGGWMVVRPSAAARRRGGEFLPTCPRSVVAGREVISTGERPDELYPGVDMGSWSSSRFRREESVDRVGSFAGINCWQTTRDPIVGCAGLSPVGTFRLRRGRVFNRVSTIWPHCTRRLPNSLVLWGVFSHTILQNS